MVELQNRNICVLVESAMTLHMLDIIEMVSGIVRIKRKNRLLKTIFFQLEFFILCNHFGSLSFFLKILVLLLNSELYCTLLIFC